MEPASVFFLNLFLAIFVLFVLNIARERAELRAARRPEGWEETSDALGFCWEKAGVWIGLVDDGVSRHVVWTDGDGGSAIPLEVVVAFCARAKEWRR